MYIISQGHTFGWYTISCFGLGRNDVIVEQKKVFIVSSNDNITERV